jgi:hypothetical protein
VGENHLLQFVSFFFNEKLLLQYTGAVLYQYAGYNLQRATTLSRFPTTSGRELQPPQLLY